METKKIEGFYGGKFFPMHLGHLLCIQTMAKQCNHGVVILFINGEGECDYLKDHIKTEDLTQTYTPDTLSDNTYTEIPVDTTGTETSY